MARTALTIGNFDGVHVGHAALVSRGRAVADRVVALAFDPHPAAILRPGTEPARLSTFEQRARWLRAAGADEVERLEATKELLGRSAEEFVREVVGRHGAIAVVEGEDFRFGKGRSGDVRTLAELGRSVGFGVEVVAGVEVALGDHQMARASSSLVRWLLSHGRVGDAERVLGRRYEMAGVVVRGDQKGRTIKCPTANLRTACMAPADGVYAAVARMADGKRYVAALSVGTRPTFEGADRRVEAHLLDFDARTLASEYGWGLTIEVVAWIREQVKYDSLGALCEQIVRDCERVREIVAAAGDVGGGVERAGLCV